MGYIGVPLKNFEWFINWYMLTSEYFSGTLMHKSDLQEFINNVYNNKARLTKCIISCRLN